MTSQPGPLDSRTAKSIGLFKSTIEKGPKYVEPFYSDSRYAQKRKRFANEFDVDVTPSSSSYSSDFEENSDEKRDPLYAPPALGKMTFLNGGAVLKDLAVSNVPGNEFSSSGNLGAQKIDFKIFGNDGTDKSAELPRSGFSGPVYSNPDGENGDNAGANTTTTTTTNRFNTSYGVGRGPRPSVVTDESMYDPDIPNLSGKTKGASKAKKGSDKSSIDAKKPSKATTTTTTTRPGEYAAEAELKRELLNVISRLDAPIVKFANKYLAVAVPVGSDSLTMNKLISVNDVNLETYPTEDFTTIIKSLYAKNPKFAESVSAHLGLALYEKYVSAVYDENKPGGLHSDEVEDLLALAGSSASRYGASQRKDLGRLSKYFLSRPEIGRGSTLRDVKSRKDVSAAEKRAAVAVMLQSYASSITERYPNTSLGDATFMFDPIFMAKIENALGVIYARTGKKFSARQVLFSDTVSTIFAHLLFYLDKARETSSSYSMPSSDPYGVFGRNSSGGANVADRMSAGTSTASPQNVTSTVTKKFDGSGRSLTIIQGRATVANIASISSEVNAILCQFKHHVSANRLDPNKLVYAPTISGGYFSGNGFVPSDFYSLFNSFDALTKDRTAHALMEQIKNQKLERRDLEIERFYSSSPTSLGPVRLLNGTWADRRVDTKNYLGNIVTAPALKKRKKEEEEEDDEEEEDPVTIQLSKDDFTKIMRRLKQQQQQQQHHQKGLTF
jgi:hypothetical protein